MTPTDVGSSGGSPPGEQRRLEDFLTNSGASHAGALVKERCEAFADSTGERCQRDAVAPFPYCSDHMHLLDEVDMRRMGLNPPKSGG